MLSGRRRTLGVLVLLTMLVGATQLVSRRVEAACVEPEPCSRHWPKGLDGPFELREVRHVQVKSHDGTMLDGWLSFPKLPRGVKAPVILISTPYLATVMR